MNARKFHAPFSVASLLHHLPLTTSPFPAFALDFSRDDDDDDGAACLLLLRSASPICRRHTRSLLLLPLLRWVALTSSGADVNGRAEVYFMCACGTMGRGGMMYSISMYVFGNDDILLSTMLCDTPRLKIIIAKGTYLHISIGLHGVVELTTGAGAG
jgi:hypothetical protein